MKKTSDTRVVNFEMCCCRAAYENTVLFFMHYDA